jgi:DNA polymerase
LKTLRIDIETRSDADLKKTGVYRYSESEHFKVLLFGYAFDGEPTVDVDLEQGQELPPRILDAIDNPEIIKTAFNANFEIVCLSRHFGRQLDPAQWRCTAVHASYLGMPNNLADVAKVVGLPEDLQKMGVGWQLIRYFCMPCKPTKVNGGRTWNLPRHDPAKWKLFREYCRRDVDVERAIANKFAKYSFPEREQRLWVIDQEINNRGIAVDTELVDRAIEMDAAVKSRLITEAIGLTGLDNVNSRDQLIGWLESAQGEEIESLTKDDVPDLISRAANGEVRRVLEIRQEMAKTSVRKYQALSSAVCADRRVRGLHQFYGANRTGRWAGRIVQPQNLPQNKLLDLDVAREMLRAGDLNMLASLFGSVPDTLSQLIRTMFIGDFRIVDFSAIEARVIAWLADCRWRMDVFDTHGKIYEASAEQMFKLPPGSVKKGDPMRQKGKVAELACIAENQLVLTDQGLVPIQSVTRSMRVWDGVEFVSHEGVIFKGIKEVITHDGLTATRDHIVFTQEGQLQFGDAAARGQDLVQSGAGWSPVRVDNDHQPRAPLHKRLVWALRKGSMPRLLGSSMGQLLKLDSRDIKGLSILFAASESADVANEKNCGYEAALPQSKVSRLQKLRSKGHSLWLRLGAVCSSLDSGQLGAEAFVGVGPHRQQWPLRCREFALGGSISAKQKSKAIKGLFAGRRVGSFTEPLFVFHNRSIIEGWLLTPGNLWRRLRGGGGQAKELARNQAAVRTARVYDLINCGPRNRFTVSDRLVHNCGYQGSVGALIAMGAVDMGIPESDLKAIIVDWRTANPEIVALWHALGDAAIKAVGGKTDVVVPVANGRSSLVFSYGGGFLTLALPSGRKLHYVKPLIESDDFGRPQLTYEGIDQKTRRWFRLKTYGGKLVENVTQAIARDCLAETLLQVPNVVMHVHDEVIAEGGMDLAEIEAVMAKPIAWAPGLKLTGDGFTHPYYRKE